MNASKNTIYGIVAAVASVIVAFSLQNPELMPKDAPWYNTVITILTIVAGGSGAKAFHRSLDRRDVEVQALKPEMKADVLKDGKENNPLK